MMRALYQIGRLVKSDSDDPLVDIVDRVAPGTHVIALELQTEEDGTVSLVNPDAPFRLLFEASQSHRAQIGFRASNSNREANITPCGFVSFEGKKVKPTALKLYIFDFYKKYQNRDPHFLMIHDFFQNKEVNETLRQHYQQFMNEKYGLLSKKKRPRVFLAATINTLLPGEQDAYRSLLVESKRTLIGGGESEGIGLCCLRNVSDTVYGKASGFFPFYTPDKAGMIASGFRIADAWKNFPVSEEAGQALKQAREYFDVHQENFELPGGFKYWVIPKFIFGSYDLELKSILVELENYSELSPGFGLGEEARKRFSEVEQRIKFIARLAKNQVLLSFLFWKQNQAQLKINLLVDDVPPTRLKRLIEVQRKVAQLKTYSTWQNETSDDPGADRSIRFSYGLIWPFYKREAQKGGKLQYGEDYLRFIRELYLGYAPDSRLILRLIMEYLEALHKDPEDKSFFYKPLHALCWLRYLCELDLWQPALKNQGEVMKLDELSIEPDFKLRDESGRFKNPWMAYIEDFYQEHQAMLANPFLFGTFLLGCLIYIVTNLQSGRLSGSTPFQKELKGLRLKKTDIPVLYSKVLTKLQEYKQSEAEKVRVFHGLISDLCLRGNQNNEQISDEEVSAWLAFGLAQGRVFKKLVDLEKDNNKANTSTSNNGEGE